MEIIELTNDLGETKDFQLVDTFGMNDDDYAVFLSLDEEELMYILRIENSDDEDIYFEGVDDEELEALIEVYEDLLAEEE